MALVSASGSQELPKPNKPRASEREELLSRELDELQRRYRLMEVGRRLTRTDDSQTAVRIQRQQIEKLKRDTERLKDDLLLETRQARVASTVAFSKEVIQLQDLHDSYVRKIEVEKQRIEELQKQVDKMRTNVEEQRKMLGGVNASRDNTMAVQKNIRILENRLDKALVKYNEAVAHNRELRNRIDNLRRDRLHSDSVHKKLERDLHERKKQLGEIIQRSQHLYDARDRAQSVMVALKEQADRRHVDFELEWSALGQLLEKDHKTREEIVAMEAERAAKAQDPISQEETKLKNRITKHAWNIARDKAAIHQAMEKVQDYEEAFARIQRATDVSDVDELVQAFLKAEDQNFTLSNQLNEESKRSEKLQERIAGLKAKLREVEGETDPGGAQALRGRLLDTLREGLAVTENSASQYEVQYSQASQSMEHLKNGISALFDKIGAYNLPRAREMTDLTDTNLMQYLGLIEERANQVLDQLQKAEETMAAVAARRRPDSAQPSGRKEAESDAKRLAPPRQPASPSSVSASSASTAASSPAPSPSPSPSPAASASASVTTAQQPEPAGQAEAGAEVEAAAPASTEAEEDKPGAEAEPAEGDAPAAAEAESKGEGEGEEQPASASEEAVPAEAKEAAEPSGDAAAAAEATEARADGDGDAPANAEDQPEPEPKAQPEDAAAAAADEAAPVQ